MTFDRFDGSAKTALATGGSPGFVTPRLIETTYGAIHCWDHRPEVGGTPLLFLQGLLAGSDAWSSVVRALSGRHRCITADWPFGAHTRPLHADADLSPPGIAGLVVEVLDQLDIERVVLVGNDSGGVVSQLVVAATPERVRALVLVACDAFEIFPPGAYRILFRLAAVPGVMRFIGRGLAVPSIARSRLGYGAVIGRAPGAAPHWTHPLRTDAGIRRDLTKLMKGSSNAQTLQAAEHFPAFAEPVLVVWARGDRLFPQALGRRLADAFPNGRLVTLDDARTFIPCDQPEPLAAVIAEFLDEHPNP